MGPGGSYEVCIYAMSMSADAGRPHWPPPPQVLAKVRHFHRTLVPPSVPYIPDKLILSAGFQFAKLLAFPITKVNNSFIRLIRNRPD